MHRLSHAAVLNMCPGPKKKKKEKKEKPLDEAVIQPISQPAVCTYAASGVEEVFEKIFMIMLDSTIQV